MTSNIFKSIEEFVNNTLEAFKDITLSDQFMWIQTSIVLLMGLLITYKGYQTLAGISQSPIRELIWDISKKLFIMIFVLNIDGWLTLAQAACSGMYEWANGSESLYSQLDNITDKYLDSINILIGSFSVRPDRIIDHNIMVLFVIICLTVGFIFIIASLAFTLITSELTNTILIMLLPLALFCLMWNSTKNIFTQWLNLFISNLITLIIYSIAMKLIKGKLDSVFTIIGTSGETISYFSTGINILFTSIIFVILVKMAAQIGQSLASVSLDASAGLITASMAGTAGAAVGGAAGLGVKGVKGAKMLANLHPVGRTVNAGRAILNSSQKALNAGRQMIGDVAKRTIDRINKNKT